jgi:outer membrane protein
MKYNKITFFIALFAIFSGYAQEKKSLSLKEAISIAAEKSDQTTMANLKASTAKLEMETVKNVSTSFGSGNTGGMEVSQLMIGQANASVPLFSGFKLKNMVSASENVYKAETSHATHAKEEIGLYVVELFAKLYQSQEMIELFKENLKSAQQRTKDFSAMVDNGLMARNDLLKAQLQESNIQISMDNAQKNFNIINYQLATLLKLPEGTIVDIDIEAVKSDMLLNRNASVEAKRSDLEALTFQQKAAEAGIKISQSGYYPSVSLMGGYIAFDLKDVMTVTNAMNFGVGVSYDLSSIFKNGKEVKLAKTKAEQAKTAVSMMNDKIKEEVQQAQENYNLSEKQNVVYKQAVEQATENYRIVKDKYDNSLSTTNDLLEADIQQLQTKINLALSQADIALKYYQLQFASGKLINSFNLTQK